MENIRNQVDQTKADLRTILYEDQQIVRRSASISVYEDDNL